MTNRYITTDQQNLNTANGDNTFIAPGVTVSYGIDMRGSGGGSQTVTVHGTLFGSIDDYFDTLSGHDQIFIGPTGSVNTYWFGAVNLAGGGNVIVNAGTISAMSYGNAVDIYAYGNSGSFQTERNNITNTGTISATSLHPERTWSDATIYTRAPGGVTLTNTGSILSSIGYAMALTEADDNVTNGGFIQGGAFLGDGNDFFDSRKGTITGPILGYSGNDTTTAAPATIRSRAKRATTGSTAISAPTR